MQFRNKWNKRNYRQHVIPHKLLLPFKASRIRIDFGRHSASRPEKASEQWRRRERRCRPLIINPLLRLFFRPTSFLRSQKKRERERERRERARKRGRGKGKEEKRRAPFCSSPASRRNAGIVLLLWRHCRTIKREDKAHLQRSSFA